MQDPLLKFFKIFLSSLTLASSTSYIISGWKMLHQYWHPDKFFSPSSWTRYYGYPEITCRFICLGWRETWVWTRENKFPPLLFKILHTNILGGMSRGTYYDLLVTWNFCFLSFLLILLSISWGLQRTFDSIVTICVKKILVTVCWCLMIFIYWGILCFIMCSLLFWLF